MSQAKEEFPIPTNPEDVRTLAAFMKNKAREVFGPYCVSFDGAGCAIALPSDTQEAIELKIMEGIAH